MADHWLVMAARNAALPGTEGLSIPAGTAIDRAWSGVAAAISLPEDEFVKRLATYLRVPVADFATADPIALKLIPENVARRYHVFPLRESQGRLLVATADPIELDAQQALQFVSGRPVVVALASPNSVREAIDSSYSPERMVEALLQRVEGDAAEDAVRVIEEYGPSAMEASDVITEPVIKLTNVLLHDAVQQGASDIHIEPDGKGAAVRFRVDGVLRPYMQMPLPALNRILSRIKVLAKLDIADRLRPQDGRARIQVGGQIFDLRISTVPTRETEKAVIRVLNTGAAHRLDDLQLPAWELRRLRRLLSHRDGIVLVTGPTGSGKTTTLYGAIRELATGDVNIMTVEDPVEYELPGITQIQMDRRRGVTFASALRAILRQDPDVILVGEIRDNETALVAVQASLTGHLVLATLHANSAVSVIPRLLDLGLDRPSIAATLRGALAQRLVRRICDGCAQRITEAELLEEERQWAERYGVSPLVRPVGCKRCGQSGYRRRGPVLEVMVVTPLVQECITRGTGMAELERAAVESGMRPLHEVAIERVAAGDTTFQEVQRVLGSHGDEAELRRAPAPASALAQPVDVDVAPAAPAPVPSAPRGGHPEQPYLLAGILESLGHAMVVFDRNGTVGWVNPAFTMMTGYSAEESIGRSLLALEAGAGRQSTRREMWETLLAGRSWRGEVLARRKDGSQYTEEQTVSPIRDPGGQVKYFVVLKQDISERKHWEQKFQHLAMHDTLTDLPNRYALEENLRRVIRQAERGRHATLLFMDVDGFKAVNGTLGRAAGDACILEVAQLLRHTLRPGDLLARLDSDDFAALLEDTPITGARAAAARLQAAMQEFRFARSGRSIILTICIGMVAVDGSLDPATLLAHGGAAVGAAKTTGPGSVVVYGEESETAPAGG
ncbi:MAG: Flp pilus assembly complex ATPase component TadA [Gemmatimonadetes bacterium]|nr:Flp pilus assembly complex ATPase component TadA [Gemmatimonadota bacterium]